ncbi:AraC family transcriptional regulator [Collimonas pratensis]|uniref:AraC family transcriptional regulator n=1 Tax=Collimonas pratensis TaxID=279113 RepID=UPI0007824A80|nr:AraC family transcriptional regulator [Collimonas pratensis]
MHQIIAEQQPRGVVPSTYVRLLYEYLEQRGVAAAALLGVPAPEAADRGSLRYPVLAWRGLLQRAADHLHDPLLGLHLGRTITAAHFGVMGYVLLACPNLGAALARTMQYQRLLYDVNPMRSTLEGSDLLLEWGVEQGRPGALVDECAITALLQLAHNATGQRIAATEIRFVNPAPADVRPYRDWFGCPVLFDQPLTSIRFPQALLGLPLRQPDTVLLNVLERQADALLAQLPPSDDFEQAVRRCIARLVREGQPELELVANELHVSARTLHRRLAASGVNFRELRESIRLRLAEDYLADPRLQLAEIAQLLGYSEQSAFTRAFRRWSGQAPYAFRLQLLSSAAR